MIEVFVGICILIIISAFILLAWRLKMCDKFGIDEAISFLAGPEGRVIGVRAKRGDRLCAELIKAIEHNSVYNNSRTNERVVNLVRKYKKECEAGIQQSVRL